MPEWLIHAGDDKNKSVFSLNNWYYIIVIG